MSSGKLTIKVNYSEVLERIKELKGLKHQKEVAQILGLSEQDFSQRKRRGTLLFIIQRWAERENIDLNTLLFGKTPAESEQSAQNKVHNLKELVYRIRLAIAAKHPDLEVLAKQTRVAKRELERFLEGADVLTPEMIEDLGVLLNLDAHPSAPALGATIPRTVLVLKLISDAFPRRIEEDDIEETIQLPELPENAFAIREKADDMLPTIKPGDYVVFLLAEAQSLKSGDIVVARDKWGSPMVKRYRLQDGRALLTNDNPDFPQLIEFDHLTLVGKVVDVWSRRKL